ncbi:MAG: hypothetical protein KUG64_00915 [Cycloclasticus sp.]|nr:hypothetical protein [Cycloclasticus sp.]
MYSPNPLYLNLGVNDASRKANYRCLFEAHIDSRVVDDIRGSVQKKLGLR